MPQALMRSRRMETWASEVAALQLAAAAACSAWSAGQADQLQVWLAAPEAAWSWFTAAAAVLFASCRSARPCASSDGGGSEAVRRAAGWAGQVGVCGICMAGRADSSGEGDAAMQPCNDG